MLCRMAKFLTFKDIDNCTGKKSMKVYNIREVAEILSIHEKTVWKFIKEGKIKGTKMGNFWRITEDEIKRILGLQGNQHQEIGKRA